MNLPLCRVTAMPHTRSTKKAESIAHPSKAWEPVKEAILRRAETRGFILPREIREELQRLGLDGQQWREFVRQAGTLLTYRNGRYYYVPAWNEARLREEERQLHVRALLQALLEHHKRSQHRQERRGAERMEVIWPITLILEDGTLHRAVTRDISAAGIRFLGTKSLLGQRVIARLSLGSEQEHVFAVRILWTCEAGDQLYENGGTVLEVLAQTETQAPAPSG
jgi:hypothetical protein